MEGSLNQFLQPTNAPVTDTVHPRSSFFFNQIGGRNSVTATKVKSVYAGNILAGTVTVGINIGTANGTVGPHLQLNGGSTQILVNDGTNNIILMGKQVGGF